MRLMVEAQVGIKTHDLSQDGEFLDQQAIGERKQGVHRVTRRTAVATLEVKRPLRRVARLSRWARLEHASEGSEIEPASVALNAQQFRDCLGALSLFGELPQRSDGLLGLLGAIAHQHGAAVTDFGCDEGAGQRQGELWVEGGAILRDA